MCQNKIIICIFGFACGTQKSTMLIPKSVAHKELCHQYFLTPRINQSLYVFNANFYGKQMLEIS